MTDLYQTLGVDQSASQDEIKNAYRRLAMKHHPDRMGGDDTKFKEIQNAYATLGDQQKRAEYDQMRQGGGQFRFNSGGFRDFSDIFGGAGPFGNQHPFQDFFGRQMRRNRDLNIQCQISLIDAYNGKQLEASYRLPSGKQQHVVINIPAGIDHGSTIKYAGLGDDTISQLPRGDLNVTVIVQPDPKFERRGHDVYSVLEITPIEAMIGARKHITTIGGATLPIDIRPCVESGIEYASNGHGFPVMNSDRRGRFVTVIKIKSQPVTDPELAATLRSINEKITNRS